MNLTIPDDLERSAGELQVILAQAMTELERLKQRKALLQATLSHHQHDFTRDLTGRPSTYPSSAHTHLEYASDTHRHNYLDGQYTLKPEQNVDATRTTGQPI